MYWAEGTKSSFVFTNTDADMIRLFLFILRKNFGVSNDRLQAMLRLGTNTNSKEHLVFWARIIGIPKEQISLNINENYNRTTTKHGLCRITVSKGSQLLKTVSAINRKLTEQVLQGKISH